MESHETSSKQIQRHGKARKERFLDFLRAAPSKDLWLQGFGVTVTAPHAFLRRVATVGYVPAAYARFFPLRAPAAFVRAVDWRALRARCNAWARRPTNAALLVWLAFVAAGVAFVFLLMTGALDSAVPDAARRRRWTEVANQVLNALFTVMCVYQHPRLCHHLALLLRWWRDDAAAAELRAVYCKNAAGTRRERLHVAVVLLLLHATCFAQYAYCALFWAFSSDTRPDWAVNFCMAFGLAAPVAAALYMVYGPLGRRIVQLPAAAAADTGDDEAVAVMAADEARYTGGRVAVARPEWAGGLFDLADDPTVAALSLTCTFCMFGWNMERMGMGNMYVHVFTFALLCAAPVLVFAVAALNIHDATLGFLVGATGALLSVLGLTYGGFWRAQMRRRFSLPADRSMCGGRPAAADYAKWLLCAPCALAQEVRTGNLYDVEDGSLYHVRGSDEDALEEEKPGMAPLEREGCVAPAPLTADKTRAGRVECVVTVKPPAPLRIMRGE
jgi:Cys-rich protein (TIGR01571 family)